jgi:hypothetical protein
MKELSKKSKGFYVYEWNEERKEHVKRCVEKKIS